MFGVDLHSPLTSEQINATVDAVARKVVARRLETPAVLFLEMHKPLAFIAGQGTMVAMPLIGPLVGPQTMADFAKLVGERANTELLIERIEELAAARDAAGSPTEEQAQ